MNIFTKPIQDIPQFDGIIKSVAKGEGPVGVNGLVDPARALFAYALAEKTGKRCMIVTHSRVKARKLHEALSIFDPESSVHFPAREIMPFSIEAKSHGYETERVGALYRLATNDYRVAVAPVEAMCIRVRKKNSFIEKVIRIERDSVLERDSLVDSLTKAGYEKCGMVESEGQFAVRGDILDVFSPGSAKPHRIDFFGDTIEKIKIFDPGTQLSENETDALLVLPVNEQTGSTAAMVKAVRAREEVSEQMARDLEKIGNGLMKFPMDKYFALEEDTDHAFSYIDRDTILIIDNDKRCLQKMDSVMKDYGGTCEKLLETRSALPESCHMVAGLHEAMGGRKAQIILPDVTGADSDTDLYRQFSILTRENPSYGGKMDLLLEDIRNWKIKGRKIAIIAPSAKSGAIIGDFLAQNGIEIHGRNNYGGEIHGGTVVMLDNGPAEGFEILEAGLCIVGSGKIFRKTGKETERRRQTAGMDLFTDLKPGDYVVHDSHGIGRYAGIENLVAAGIRRDYMKVVYKNEDSVYIPVTKLDSIQKYIGSGGGAPKLSRLGGRDWETAKARVSESVKDIARELVELYAKRKAIKGRRYSADTIWQVSFEEEFPYEETPDQLRCIEEIKEDMESDSIMDRLLCGDVGYGKTEVALRAAFKAVMDGMQVAFLVPTTVLAYQHFNTFTERLRNFPVSIGLMCRFRNKKELQRTAAGLKAGSIDIVVGTHRLLQKDIGFSKLGLLVIDEEQRFGVEHKEKIKNYKNDVDVLALTATPIPRTLHMSLSGIRDISVIEDPPAKRFPIQTYVMEYDGDIVRDAVDREISRGGQVFYLYNRVEDMDRKYSKLVKLLGEDVRIGIAHGQMDEGKLEAVMVDFIEGRLDVLLCTTIIESGLDIPNVNTMIIEDADRMGLSQLYQIRGRVGRSDKVAYAYITHRHGKVITEEASKRLEAIREFTEFGSGFKIAMRDLEIRGAGSLLGASQHGHMEKVGYDMYIRILNRAVRELGGQAAQTEEQKAGCTVELNINAYISREYIDNDLMRMEMYKKIAVVASGADRKALLSEMTDRFGRVPEETAALLDVALAKNIAGACGVSSISRSGRDIFLTFEQGRFPGPEGLGRAAQALPGRVLVNMGQGAGLRIRNNSLEKIDFKGVSAVLNALGGQS
ncbi:MAG: transcription-repair coupling factor [Clostridia bacterium]|nr:transcription-repair coupling factor [Clostridia bacterium]